MQYGNMVMGRFLSRPNRFIARVEVDGREETAHVKNTGRCAELLVPGAEVWLQDHSGAMGSRKLRWSLIGVKKGHLLINMDSQAPNKAAMEALASGIIQLPGMGKLKVIRPETVHGDSRFDFFIQDEDGRKAFIEVKGVTLEKDGICSFPDAPTVRGAKHLRGLAEAVREGFGAYILFIIQMEGMKYLRPNDETDPAFGTALREAESAGVKCLAYECAVTPQSLCVRAPVPVCTDAWKNGCNTP